jgi:hypothetical protein
MDEEVVLQAVVGGGVPDQIDVGVDVGHFTGPLLKLRPQRDGSNTH